MSIWIAILFGIVQGVTEFLPVSSSGHIVLLGELTNNQVTPFFTLLLHFASLVAIVLFFWNDIVWCLKNPLSKKTLGLGFATFCTAAIAFSVAKLTDINSAVALGPLFIASGVTLVVAELVVRFAYKKKDPKQITLTSSFAVGVLQGLCIMPGLSRLGTTVSTLRICGVSNKEATSFSFLLSVPVVVGGIVLELAKGTAFKNNIGVLPCIFGFVFSFAFACCSLVFLKNVIKNKHWWVFAPYLIAIGIIVSIWQYA